MPKLRTAITSIFTHFLIWLFLIFALYPILWVIALAFSKGVVPESRVLPVPSHFSLEHFQAVILRTDAQGRWLFARQLWNSTLTATATALVSVLIATPAAYAFSRFDFVGKATTLRGLLATQMFPGVAASVPLYLVLDTLNLLDTLSGLVLVYATSTVPFALFQLRSTFDTIPRDLDEAAMVDGASRVEAFLRVVLPVARPGIAITALFAFMSAWNEFILAATFLSREEHYTLPMLLQSYATEHDANLGHFAAGAILVSLPVMILFYLLQRELVAGLTAGGVKG
ncbi:MAG: ABC transporter permease subunit [Sandaracinaceae bacterium]|nr:ABC transporter permease subunit [Sandaracinaceae bacterium]